MKETLRSASGSISFNAWDFFKIPSFSFVSQASFAPTQPTVLPFLALSTFFAPQSPQTPLFCPLDS
jgi:hypothetical protein